MAIQPLFDEPFLRAQWGAEFVTFQETALNTQIYRLYDLTPEEIATVEAG